jgi:hypothetical protein
VELLTLTACFFLRFIGWFVREETRDVLMGLGASLICLADVLATFKTKTTPGPVTRSLCIFCSLPSAGHHAVALEVVKNPFLSASGGLRPFHFDLIIHNVDLDFI